MRTLTCTRRGLLVGAAAGLLAPRPARAAGRRVLLAGGSSMAGALGLALEQELSRAGHTVVRKARAATGLARPDYYDWVAAARKLAARHHPEAAVINLGGNDGQSLFMGTDADPEWIRWEDPAWPAAYRRRIAALCDALAPAGQPVFWLGMPIPRQPKLRRRLQRINDLARDEMAARPAGLYIHTWDILAPQGTFTLHMVLRGKKVQVRSEDGVHLTRAGARYLAAQVTPRIAAALGAA